MMKIIIVSLALIVCWVSCAPTGTSTPGTTKKPFVKLSCEGHPHDGFFVDPKDPHIFHQCSHGQHIATFECKNSTVFEEAQQTCVAPHQDFKCPEKDGLFPFPGNIHKFIECFENRVFVKTCAADLIFDEKTDQCVFNEGNSPWPSDPTTVPTKPPTTAPTKSPTTAQGTTSKAQ